MAPSKWTLPASTAGKVPESQTCWCPVTLRKPHGCLRLCSLRLPGLRLPLRKRRPGRDGAVLQEGHLDPAHPGVPTHGGQHGQDADAGIPPEEDRRAGLSVFLPGPKASHICGFMFVFSLNVGRFDPSFPFFAWFILDAHRSALLRLPPARAQRFWQGTFTRPSCALHSHLDSFTVGFLPLQACGVDFEVKAYLANVPHNIDEVIEKKYVSYRQRWGDSRCPIPPDIFFGGGGGLRLIGTHVVWWFARSSLLQLQTSLDQRPTSPSSSWWATSPFSWRPPWRRR